jgi:Na+-driven multidrug efflux pump
VLGPLLVLFGSLWIARIPFAYAFAPSWGADAIWWSFPLGSLVGVILGGLYYRFGDWRRVEIMRGVKQAAAPVAPQAATGNE